MFNICYVRKKTVWHDQRLIVEEHFVNFCNRLILINYKYEVLTENHALRMDTYRFIWVIIESFLLHISFYYYYQNKNIFL